MLLAACLPGVRLRSQNHLLLKNGPSGFVQVGDQERLIQTRPANCCLMAEEIVGPRLYSCCNCRNHVSLHDDIISKTFQGRNGRAFLFSHAMNIEVGPKEDRYLLTGLHTVADVHCADCRELLGWKYERAYDALQKYKEGKFILEKSKIVKENW